MRNRTLIRLIGLIYTDEEKEKVTIQPAKYAEHAKYETKET